MKVKILCDRCKHEFDCEEEVADGLGEVICPDCKEDNKL